jgi:hypothetical protein
MLPFKSLTGAATTGPGDSHDLETVCRDHTLFVTDTSGLTAGAVSVALEGSADDQNWTTLVTGGFSGATGTNAVSTVAGNTYHWVRYVRANVVSNSGSRVIDAWIASHVDEET